MKNATVSVAFCFSVSDVGLPALINSFQEFALIKITVHVNVAPSGMRLVIFVSPMHGTQEPDVFALDGSDFA